MKFWDEAALSKLYLRPFNDLLFEAQRVHREHFDPNRIQMSSLLSIKTGGCPEDCAYCPQSAHFATGLKSEPLMKKEEVWARAREAKTQGAERFCMGAAWRSPNEKDLKEVCEMVAGVKAMGLETCATLGLLSPEQSSQLKEAGLDFYNHNIDSSPDYYKNIISTRNFGDRIDTLNNVSRAGMKVCCGGIVGMGETLEDRLKMISELTNLETPPESVPLNLLIPIEGTPLEKSPPLDALSFVRLIAVTRIALPRSYVRIAAGREFLNEEAHALCFFAGANSIFLGEKLLTAKNPSENVDMALLGKLGLRTSGHRGEVQGFV